MFTHYIKVAFRNMAKHKIFTLINISGLMLGISCCLLVFIYVADEFSYDRFHENRDNLYRILINRHTVDGSIDESSWRLAPVVKNGFLEYCPEIKTIIRNQNGYGTAHYKKKAFNERIGLADKEFFQVFSFPLKYGNPETVIAQDNAVVFTESYAEKYFGNINPLGK